MLSGATAQRQKSVSCWHQPRLGRRCLTRGIVSRGTVGSQEVLALYGECAWGKTTIDHSLGGGSFSRSSCSRQVYAGLSMLTGQSLSRGAVSGLIWAALFGPAFLWISGKVDTKVREKRGLADSDGPVSSESIHVRALPKEVLDTAIRAAEQIPRARVVRSDQRGVYIQMGMSLGSWGERVQVEALPQGDGTCVTVTSRPGLRMTLFDYGKGRENVRRLTNAIKEHGLSD